MSGRLQRNVFVKIKYIGDVLALNCVKVKKMIKVFYVFPRKERRLGHLIKFKNNSSLYMNIVMTL